MAMKTQLNAADAQLNKKLQMDDFFYQLDVLGMARVSQEPLDRISENLERRYFRQRLREIQSENVCCLRCLLLVSHRPAK